MVNILQTNELLVFTYIWKITLNNNIILTIFALLHIKSVIALNRKVIFVYYLVYFMTITAKRCFSVLTNDDVDVMIFSCKNAELSQFQLHFRIISFPNFTNFLIPVQLYLSVFFRLAPEISFHYNFLPIKLSTCCST